jgi:hypothetical protein
MKRLKFLLVTIGYWLQLVVGYNWLLVTIGCWLQLVISYWLLVTGFFFKPAFASWKRRNSSR